METQCPQRYHNARKQKKKSSKKHFKYPIQNQNKHTQKTRTNIHNETKICSPMQKKAPIHIGLPSSKTTCKYQNKIL